MLRWTRFRIVTKFAWNIFGAHSFTVMGASNADSAAYFLFMNFLFLCVGEFAVYSQLLETLIGPTLDVPSMVSASR